MKCSMDGFIEWITTYGYYAVFLGSLVEGESVILTASSLAAMEKMNLYKIMIVAFCGTWIADQGLYMLGRHYGKSVFEKFPFLTHHSKRAFDLLHKYDHWFIIACRFIYGIRITSAVVIGVSGLSPKRFIPLNTISAVIWTLVSCIGGYLIGETFLKFLHKIAQYQKMTIGILVGALVIYIALKIYKKNKKQKKNLR
jgi:membrane protein DedA with SNARE-associated domain